MTWACTRCWGMGRTGGGCSTSPRQRETWWAGSRPAQERVEAVRALRQELQAQAARYEDIADPAAGPNYLPSAAAKMKTLRRGAAKVYGIEKALQTALDEYDAQVKPAARAYKRAKGGGGLPRG